MIKDELCAITLRFLNDGILDEGLNKTRIFLIPKQKNANKLKDFRPIGLVNISMKLISKAIAIRLKEILPQIISSSQNAFFKGRLISDNIFLVYEICHFIKGRKYQKLGAISLKLDMSKAFDRVEWRFLKQMLLKLGFRYGWVKKVLTCVRSVRYRVKLNDGESRIITPERGLRQGDPPSPYLFIICKEWLSASLVQAEWDKLVEGIKICRRAPTIFHFFC